MRTELMERTRPGGQGRGEGGSSSTKVAVCLLAALLAGACSPQMYRARADRETYTALFEKARNVKNVEPADLELPPPDPVDLGGLPTRGASPKFLGEAGSKERGAKVLKLDEALELGIRHSREYQEAREEVFLSALDLTLARHRLAPIGFAGGRGTRANDSRAAELEAGMTELVSTNTFARTQTAGFDWLLATGARVSTSFTQDFLRIMTGNRSINESDLAVSVVQPLLQGGGFATTLEALTQEERNLLYDLRGFADYRRAFIVDLVSDYYEVLRSRDRVSNNFVAFEGFVKNVEREEALADEDRRTQTQLGQLRQAKLQAESRWIDSIRLYQSQLDNFKITLGVPVETQLVLDDSELDQLRIEQPPVTRDQSLEIALVARPDLATAADRFDDAARRIKVAKNGLLPRLDLSLDYNAVSDPGDTTPAINWDRRRWSSSVDLDLAIDRKAERNLYRASFIALERAARDAELARDRASLEILDSWRALDQARLNFDIAEQGVALSGRRLEEQTLLAELGRGEARDLVEAQEDLVNAQNQRTSTLVDHTLARLRLWRDMGILYINRNGTWAETLANESP